MSDGRSQAETATHEHRDKHEALRVSHPRMRAAYAAICVCGAYRFMQQAVPQSEWVTPDDTAVRWRP